MLKAKQMSESETFNDGTLNVLEATDGVIKKNLFENIHCGFKTFGVKRFFSAQEAGSEIEKMIVVPFNDEIKRDNLIELTDFRTHTTSLYEVVMLQILYDSAPKSLQLSLRKTTINYVDNRSDNQTS